STNSRYPSNRPTAFCLKTEAANYLLPTTKVLVASRTHRTYGITPHFQSSSAADDQLFRSRPAFIIAFLQTPSEAAPIGLTCANSQSEAATMECNQLDRLSLRRPTT